MLVKDIIDRVTVLYNDQDYDRISQNQYLQFLDDTLNQLLLARPDANVKTVDYMLKRGTRQSLPDDAYSLIDIYMNKDDDGKAGLPILQVERKNLDYFSNWQAAPAQKEIYEFSYDLRTPKSFWVSPPSDGTSVIEMDYSAKFDTFADSVYDFDFIMGTEVPVESVFKGPIISYMLYLLYSTDSSSAQDRQVAAAYERSFYQSLGLEYQANVAYRPTNEETETGVPTVQGGTAA